MTKLITPIRVAGGKVGKNDSHVPAASPEEAYTYEYGLALVKTSASLRITYQLAQVHHLRPATDSRSHHDLFAYSLARERLVLEHDLMSPFG